MSVESSIFRALNESKRPSAKTPKRRNEQFDDSKVSNLPVDNAVQEEEQEPILEGQCPYCEVDLVDGVCPDCGYTEETINEEECPDCGLELEDGTCPDCGYSEEDEEPANEEGEELEDQSEEEDDPLQNGVNEGRIRVGRYNMDTVRMMGEMLTRASAPNAIRKAYNMKMYERCAKWLKTAKGMDVDLREGFSKSEQKVIRKRLNEMRAPKYVKEAFEGGQYSIVSSYFRAKAKK